MTQAKRGRPRKQQVLSGAERARRYRARQSVTDHKQLIQILQLFRNEKDQAHETN